jgi:hypothetical protein
MTWAASFLNTPKVFDWLLTWLFLSLWDSAFFYLRFPFILLYVWVAVAIILIGELKSLVLKFSRLLQLYFCFKLPAWVFRLVQLKICFARAPLIIVKARKIMQICWNNLASVVNKFLLLLFYHYYYDHY